MNRHHYGLFVHKCRLVLLVRRQPVSVSDVLGPAEWRWNLQWRSWSRRVAMEPAASLRR